MRAREPGKARHLVPLYEALVAKRALSTLRELRSFATDNGLEFKIGNSRDKALGPFLWCLAAHSADEIGNIVSRINYDDLSGDRTLEGWTDVILDNRHTR